MRGNELSELAPETDAFLSSLARTEANNNGYAETRTAPTMTTTAWSLTTKLAGGGVKRMHVLRLLPLLLLLLFLSGHVVSTASAANSTYGKVSITQ